MSALVLALILGVVLYLAYVSFTLTAGTVAWMVWVVVKMSEDVHDNHH